MTISEDVLGQVNKVFADVFANPSIVVRAETTAEDIPEWDSLNHTELIAAIEQRFQIKFSLREVMRFENVGDMCAVIRTKLGA
jgi:acyl carrier protein